MIDGSALWYLMFRSGLWGGHLPSAYVVPRTTFTRPRELWLGSTVEQLFEFAATVAGESLDVTMTWLPTAKVLHVADVVWPGSHTFFADGTSVPDWLIQLDHLRELVSDLRPRVIVPGHGAPGDIGMIDALERYLRAWPAWWKTTAAAARSPSPTRSRESSRRDIVNEFPEHRNRIRSTSACSSCRCSGRSRSSSAVPTARPHPGCRRSCSHHRWWPDVRERLRCRVDHRRSRRRGAPARSSLIAVWGAVVINRGFGRSVPSRRRTVQALVARRAQPMRTGWKGRGRSASHRCRARTRRCPPTTGRRCPGR